MTPTRRGVSRRRAFGYGAVGLFGLGSYEGPAARSAGVGRRKAVIYIFLSGGLAQHDSFDPKPDAPEGIRGEFKPIATKTPGLFICEHLPKLAERSDRWALVRSLTHPYNEHSIGHHVMLTGRTPTPVGFDSGRPKPGDFPSIASVVSNVIPRRGDLPSAAVLPEKLVHVSGRSIPGQFAGEMGAAHDPWFIEASHYRDTSYIHGAFPEYGFQRWEGKKNPPGYRFEAPRSVLSPGEARDRLSKRLKLLDVIETRPGGRFRNLDYDRRRAHAVSLLLDDSKDRALDVHSADARTRERYGNNSFGWSLLMAKRLVEAGVSFVQVNLGNDESWDTHESAFGNLKDFLLPPTDRAVSGLLDDLSESGMIDDVLVVMAGEFGRTPRIFTFPGAKSNRPGRDHWGAVQTVFLAGGGVRGGAVIGASDRIGAYPNSDPVTPENLAAVMYQALDLPSTAVWKDKLDRPHPVYHGDSIQGI